MSKRTTDEVPNATHWYIEPKDKATNAELAGYLSDDPSSVGQQTSSGRWRLWSATYAEVLFFEQSRKTNPELQFSVWYKNKETSVIELWRSNESYLKRNPSLNPSHGRKLRRSLTNGEGQPMSFPRKVGRPKLSLKS